MATDNGQLSLLEAAAKTVLAALTFGEGSLFASCDHWRDQIRIGDKGLENFDAQAPFAYVQCTYGPAVREGGYQANIPIELHVFVGAYSRQINCARIGTGTDDIRDLGTNHLTDRIILALEKWHPGASFACDEFYIRELFETVNGPHRHAVEIVFTANRIGVYNPEAE